MKIHTIRFTNESSKLVNGETNILAANREMKMVAALVFHLKILLVTTKARMKG
jgi:hypothetical protein